MLRKHKLKKTLQAGSVALGPTILELRSPRVVYLMAAAEVDFVLPYGTLVFH